MNNTRHNVSPPEDWVDPTEKYQIRWLSNAVEYVGDKTKLAAHLGICEKNRRVVFIYYCVGGVEELAPLWLHDTFVEDGRCEDGAWCLCLDCPHNRTTFTSYKHGRRSVAKHFLLKKSSFDILISEVKEFEKLFGKEIQALDFSKRESLLFRDPPLKVNIRRKSPTEENQP